MATTGRRSRLAAPCQALRIQPSQEHVAFAHDAFAEPYGSGELRIVELSEGRRATPVEGVIPAAANGVVEQDAAETMVLGHHPAAVPPSLRQLVADQLSIAPKQFIALHTVTDYQVVPSSPGITHRPSAATRPITMLS